MQNPYNPLTVIEILPTKPNANEQTELRLRLKKIGDKYERTIGAYCLLKDGCVAVELRGRRLGKKDGGIDIVAEKKDKTLLIQCKCWTNPKTKRDNGKSMIYDLHDMKEFYGECSRYISENGLDAKNVSCKLVMPTKECLDVKSIVPYLNELRKHKENIALSYDLVSKDGVKIENTSDIPF
jgi:hypothetical protein